MRAKDYEKARHLARTIGTQTYYQAIPAVDYILAFAHDKGKQYVDQAQTESNRIIAKTLVLSICLVAIVLATALAVFFRVRFLQRELARQATTDFLTGIPNRRNFMELAKREFRRSQRHGSPFALVVADLDLFKSINDSHGHPVGDRVLKKFCAVCNQTLRNLDTLGRVSGEEFAILLPNTGLIEAREVTERVRMAIESAEVMAGQTPPLRFTGSFGLTVYAAGDQDITALFRRADAALYEAEENGRNRVCVHEP